MGQLEVQILLSVFLAGFVFGALAYSLFDSALKDTKFHDNE